jgi:flagellar biosynthesis protein FlhG
MRSRRKIPSLSEPVDQAAGLRRLFGGRTLRFVPVISNPFISHGNVLIERLCSTFGELGMKTLVVDASEQGSEPKELTRFDLAEGIEPLSSRVNYLAARGLPLRWVNESGSTRAFLDSVADAAAAYQVVLVHAGALDLARLFGRGDDGLSRPRPVVLCDDRPEAMTHAYAAVKIVAQRAEWLTYDLLFSAPPACQRARTVAERLGHCADLFLGGVQRSWVQVDPTEHAGVAPTHELSELASGLFNAAARYSASGDQQFAALVRPSVLPATPHNSMN